MKDTPTLNIDLRDTLQEESPETDTLIVRQNDESRDTSHIHISFVRLIDDPTEPDDDVFVIESIAFCVLNETLIQIVILPKLLPLTSPALSNVE